MGLSLLLFVQASNVYPQLLLARLLFSLGGSATATMVTAILPAMTASPSRNDFAEAGATGENTSLNDAPSSLSSDLTVTPARVKAPDIPSGTRSKLYRSSPTSLAGFVGLFTGLGALVALGLFLPLLAHGRIPDAGPGASIVSTYYIVAIVAFSAAIACFLGLRNVKGEENKGLKRLLNLRSSDTGLPSTNARQSYLSSLWESLRLGIGHSLIGLGYLGGFVARASSVGISLFIPLYVNAYYISSGNCQNPVDDPSEIKSTCPQAYVLAAELTGISQLFALVMAPAFGYFADRYQRHHVPLLLAAVAGILGYLGLANLKTPLPSGNDGNPVVLVLVSLIGISQIGCIVCSLGLLGRGILGLKSLDFSEAEATASRLRSETIANENRSPSYPTHNPSDSSTDPLVPIDAEQGTDALDAEETTNLLGRTPETPQSLNHLKGSIAGVYSFAGGAGILLLTKLGGYLFDTKSNGAPFYMLAIFNILLLFTTGHTAIIETRQTYKKRHVLVKSL